MVIVLLLLALTASIGAYAYGRYRYKQELHALLERIPEYDRPRVRLEIAVRSLFGYKGKLMTRRLKKGERPIGWEDAVMRDEFETAVMAGDDVRARRALRLPTTPIGAGRATTLGGARVAYDDQKMAQARRKG
jgi:hypothetical protein